MADIGSSDTYTVKIMLETEVGDLPSRDDVESLVYTQMDGWLDDPSENGGTGLRCWRVAVIGSEHSDDNPFDIITSLARDAQNRLATGAINLAHGLLNDIINYIDAECV